MAVRTPNRLHHSLSLDPPAIVGPGEDFLKRDVEWRGKRTLTQDAEDSIAHQGCKAIQVDYTLELHAIAGLHGIRSRA